MPCYDDREVDERKELQARNDKLTRIACTLMKELETQELDDFILLQNDEICEWWTEHKELDRKRRFEFLEESVETIRDLVKIQGQKGTWDSDKYMLGLFNGLELASATLEKRSPQLRTLEPDVGRDTVKASKE